MISKSDQDDFKFPYLKHLKKVRKDILGSIYFEQNLVDKGDDKALEFSAQAAAAFCLVNGIKANHFNCLFRYYLVDFLKKDQPKISNLQVAIRTGIDRRLVGKVNKYAKPTKEQIILSYLKVYCKREKTDVIKKKGLRNSFEYFCKKGANGTLTSRVLAEELIRLGHIKDIGSRFRVILS